jgi:soluble lytic murein transglycosylase-like protein
MKIAAEYIKSNYSRLPREVTDRIAYSVYTHARKWDLNPHLIMGIIETESRFDPTLTSKAGAKGLMQVLTGGRNIDIDWERIHDIEYNIIKGIEILRAHIKAVGGKLDKALSNYSGRHNNYVQEVNKNVGNFVLFRDEFLKRKNKSAADKN